MYEVLSTEKSQLLLPFPSIFLPDNWIVQLDLWYFRNIEFFEKFSRVSTKLDEIFHEFIVERWDHIWDHTGTFTNCWSFREDLSIGDELSNKPTIQIQPVRQ